MEAAEGVNQRMDTPLALSSSTSTATSSQLRQRSRLALTGRPVLPYAREFRSVRMYVWAVGNMCLSLFSLLLELSRSG